MTLHNVGIESIAEYLPPRVASVAELDQRGLLRGSADTLRSFGFETVRLAGDESNLDMAIAAAEKVIEESKIDRDEIGMILYAAALNSSSTLWNGNGVSRPGSVLDLGNVHDLFKYPGSVVQTRLDLPNAAVVGINQVGCASIFAALRMARALIATEDTLRAVLCVSADKFPSGQPRDLAYNLVSDGACAALVRRDAERNRIVECMQVTKGALWESDEIENEIIAAYFPTAASLIERTLAKAGLTIDDIALVIPHNVSMRSWEILGRLIKCPADRIYTNNISKVGHTIASDNLLNLRHATEAGLVAKGDYMLLFTFGYGSNWACMVVQH
ncbi:MAG TPA: 3-oxoacyl-[acyl-carrier-protein] synthase III C-terminal domain-containing protein [Gemmatimonadaceae bacterium]|nr:3-oxoacyl-[acyl-carrier-protein] synthase III C-terminal domain-containing protein [Gemmatimonadaceae bacterium]